MIVDDISYFVKRVTFKLHDTYANPTRSESPLPPCPSLPSPSPSARAFTAGTDIDKPPFEVSETGCASPSLPARQR